LTNQRGWKPVEMNLPKSCGWSQQIKDHFAKSGSCNSESSKTKGSPNRRQPSLHLDVANLPHPGCRFAAC